MSRRDGRDKPGPLATAGRCGAPPSAAMPIAAVVARRWATRLRPSGRPASRCGLLILVILALLAILPAGGGPAQAQQPAADAVGPASAESTAHRPVVRVHGGRHDDFSRLVFDWANPVGYRVDRNGDVVQVQFDHPADADLSAAQPGRVGRVRDLRQISSSGNLVVVMTVPANTRLRHLYLGTKVVVDIVDGEEEAAAAGVPAPSATSPPAATPAPAAPNAAPGNRAPPGATSPNTAPSGAAPAGRAPAGAAPPASPALAPGGPAGSATAVSGPAQTPGQAPAQAERRARFDPGAVMDAAVFQRGGNLWVIFAGDSVPDAEALADQSAAGLGRGTVVPAEGGAALLFAAGTPLQPVVGRDGTAWTVTLPVAPQPTPNPLEVLPQPDFPPGPRLLVGTEGARRLVRTVDPGAGDTLLAVPLPMPGSGLPVVRRFIEVTLLPTGQGVVAEPRREDVIVRPTGAGVEITAVNGLALSPSTDAGITALPALQGERLFDIPTWQGPPGQFVQTRQALQRQVAEVPETLVDRARLDLARFYFAHHYGQETLGLLRLVERNAQGLAERPDFKALRGAARVLAGDPAGALADLESPDLAASAEAALWRAAAAVTAGRWATAANEFARAGDLVDRYPQPFREQFALWAAEVALRQGDLAAAQERLSRLAVETEGRSDYRPGVAYLRGEIARAAGNREIARIAWERAAGTNDQLYRTLAELALIDLAVETGNMTPHQAAERLEALRFAWRGDELEFRLLERLGDLHWQDGAYRDALVVWRRAIDRFPNLPGTVTLRARRQERFADLLSSPAGDALSPPAAISLYEDYRDLMPTGAAGDRIVERLAERLVGIDLLDRAGDMLQQLVETRLAGEDKARVATRLAGIRLLDNKPEAALSVLDRSEGSTSDAGMLFERRLLRARALSQLGRPDAALAVLVNDESRLVEAARLDIAWRAQNWPLAARTLASLVGDAPPLGESIDAGRAQLVLNYGIALALAGDRAGLDRLSVAFGPAMAGTPDANTFAVLTRSTGPTGAVADLAGIRRQVSELQLFQNFLDGYRSSAPRRPVLTN